MIVQEYDDETEECADLADPVIIPNEYPNEWKARDLMEKILEQEEEVEVCTL